jgi:acyl-CoA thioesterase-2
VVAVQHGRAIFNLSASFARPEPGIEHQLAMPAVPPPEELPTLQERLGPYAGALPEFFARDRPIELRYVVDPPFIAAQSHPREPSSAVWLRAAGQLPADPLLHVCVLAYASDITLLDSVLVAHGLAWGNDSVTGASLDHAMWFHRPFRADEWLLYDQESWNASGARALATGRIYRRDGVLVATVMQEGLLRRPRTAPEATNDGAAAREGARPEPAPGA